MNMKVYNVYKSAGLCVRCGCERAEGVQFCARCAEYNRIKVRERYAKKVKGHKCVNCGKPLPKDWYYVECEVCKTKKRESRLARNDYRATAQG